MRIVSEYSGGTGGIGSNAQPSAQEILVCTPELVRVPEDDRVGITKPTAIALDRREVATFLEVGT
jgi:hypothetical protein